MDNEEINYVDMAHLISALVSLGRDKYGLTLDRVHAAVAHGWETIPAEAFKVDSITVHYLGKQDK